MKFKTQKKYIRIIGAIIGLSLLAAGCGSSNTTAVKKVVLNVWGPFDDSENLQPLFSAYKQKYSNVQIVYTKKDISTYESDLLDALASGTGPDIYVINNSWLPKYKDKISAAPDTVFTYKDYKDTFVDVAVNDFTEDQKIYGVPLYVDSLGLFYNKDILGTAGIATPPKTWDELSTDVRKIRRADSSGYFTLSGLAMGSNTNVNRAVDMLYLLMLQKGTVPFSADGSKATFSQSLQQNGSTAYPGLDGLNFYTSFADPTSPNYNWNSRSDYSIDAFSNGRAAFLYNYSYTAATIKQKNPNLNFDVAPVPQPNLTDSSVNFANYWGEVVSSQSKNTAAAWSFLKYLSSKSSLDTFYAKDKHPSSRKDLISLQIQDPDIGVFAAANLTAKSFYKPDQTKLDNIFGKVIDNVILNGLTTSQALSQAEQQATALTRLSK